MIRSIKKNLNIQLIMKLLTFALATNLIVPVPIITGSQYFWGLFIVTVIYNIYLISIDIKKYITNYKLEMLFIIWCLISASINYKFNNIYSIVNIITTSILIFNLTTVHPMINEEKFKFETYILDYFLIIFTFIIGLLSLYFFIQNPVSLIQGERVIGLYLNSNQMGFWAFISVLLSYKHRNNKFNIINFILELFLIFVSGSRAVYISLAIFIFYIIYYNSDKISLVKKKTFLVTLTIFAVILVIFITLIRYKWLFTYFEKLGIEIFLNALTGYRFSIWKEAIEVFLHYPIFGVGVNNINNAAKLVLQPSSIIVTGGWEDPHNIIICLLGYTGIVGAILFFILIYNKVKYVILDKQKFMIVSIISLFTLSFFDIGIVFDERILSVYFWYLIGQLNCIKFLERDINVEKN